VTIIGSIPESIPPQPKSRTSRINQILAHHQIIKKRHTKLQSYRLTSVADTFANPFRMVFLLFRTTLLPSIQDRCALRFTATPTPLPLETEDPIQNFFQVNAEPIRSDTVVFFSTGWILP
jgi:hypothetical protein